MNKITIKVLFSFVCLLPFMACQTRNPYPGLQSGRDKGNYYFIESKDSDRLIIYLEGSGYESVLGSLNDEGHWDYTNLANPLIKKFRSEYNVLIPEKLNFDLGQNYNNNKAVYAEYNVENLVSSYKRSIDYFLSQREFSSIYIIGASEGGYLLPAVYRSLKHKSEIDKLVFIGSGGLSQLDELRILGESVVEMPNNYREICLQIDDVWKDIQLNPNSVDNFYLRHPYSRWSSFFSYTPIDDIRSINKPVLFIQGELDWSTPVESTRIIEEEHISDKFEFIYYNDMEHDPASYIQLRRLLKDIEKWLSVE